MSGQRSSLTSGTPYTEPSYTYRGFQSVPDDPAHPEADQFYGYVFQDTDFYKWIEAVAYSLTQHPDRDLEESADRAINLVCAAQHDSGYLDTYYIINGMDRAFTNLPLRGLCGGEIWAGAGTVQGLSGP